MKVLILAGGFATRLWPLTENRAKPLLLLDGKTILAHILQKIPTDADIYLLTNKKFEKDFASECAKLGRRNVEIFCEDAHSDGEKLGALRALSVAIKHYQITENVVVLAGDNILPELKIEQILCSTNEAKLAIREVADMHEAQKFGVVEVEEPKTGLEKERPVLKIGNFEEKPEHPKSQLVSTGFVSIGSDLFPILHNFAEKSPDALGSIFTEFLTQKKTVLAAKIGGEWFDVGSFETYLEAHKRLQKEDLKISFPCHPELDSGSTFANSKKTPRSPIKPGMTISSFGNVFSGKVFIGEGAVVRNCKLTDAIIYPGTQLRNCHISQSVIDGNCDLEGLDLNRKLVRKGTVLKSE